MNLSSCGKTTKPVTIVSDFNTSHIEIWKSKNKQKEVKEREQKKEKSLSPKYLQEGQEQIKILYVTKGRKQ